MAIHITVDGLQHGDDPARLRGRFAWSNPRGDYLTCLFKVIQMPMSSMPNGIVTLKNRTLGPVARIFIEHAREVAKPLARA